MSSKTDRVCANRKARLLDLVRFGSVRVNRLILVSILRFIFIGCKDFEWNAVPILNRLASYLHDVLLCWHNTSTILYSIVPHIISRMTVTVARVPAGGQLLRV